MIKRFFSTISKQPIIVTNNAWKKMDSILQQKKTTFFIFQPQVEGVMVLIMI
jgi:hypothetical protein